MGKLQDTAPGVGECSLRCRRARVGLGVVLGSQVLLEATEELRRGAGLQAGSSLEVMGKRGELQLVPQGGFELGLVMAMAGRTERPRLE